MSGEEDATLDNNSSLCFLLRTKVSPPLVTAARLDKLDKKKYKKGLKYAMKGYVDDGMLDIMYMQINTTKSLGAARSFTEIL